MESVARSTCGSRLGVAAEEWVPSMGVAARSAEEMPRQGARV